MNVKAKLKEAQIKEIRRLRELKVRATVIAVRFGITVRMVHMIWSRRAWKHVA
jgi:DNA-binding transcriptional regulator YiaG